MLDFPGLLMVVGGLGLLAVGIRKKDWMDAGIGCGFIGSAVFNGLGRSNPVYVWLQLACVIGMAILVVAKFRAVRKRNKSAGR